MLFFRFLSSRFMRLELIRLEIPPRTQTNFLNRKMYTGALKNRHISRRGTRRNRNIFTNGKRRGGERERKKKTFRQVYLLYYCRRRPPRNIRRRSVFVLRESGYAPSRVHYYHFENCPHNNNRRVINDRPATSISIFRNN